MGITAEEALGASMAYTNKKVSESAGLHREIVTSLPATGDENIIYMVLDQTASSPDIYDEWLWTNGAYEHIGSTRVDLTDYYNKTQVDTALSGKANTATSLSGYGITDAYTKTEVDTALSGKASTSDIPTALSSLSDDSTHRVVTDTEKSTWNGKSNITQSDVNATVNALIKKEAINITISSIAANSWGMANKKMTIPEGYSVLGIVSVGGSSVAPEGAFWSPSNNNVYINYWNHTNQTLYNDAVYCTILYIKNS